VSDRLPAALRAYRALSTAARPLTPLLLAQRARRGKEDRERLAERRGQSAVARPPGGLVWVHGASVGELASVLPLILRICETSARVLVTTGTVTSGALAGKWLPAGVVHQFVPLDVPRYVRRFLDHWKPDLALFVESDLWPNRIIEASRSRVPIILVNARLSDDSFRRWRQLPAAITNLLGRFDLCLARTAADAERFATLGATRIVQTGDLKLDVPAPPCNQASLAAMQGATARRPLLAAASTHAGEENAMIAAHRQLRRHFPGLLTIIAPRHPQRGDEVAALAAAAGLAVRQRGRGQMPDASTEVYVADTMGELGLIYRLVPVVFVGGSLVRHGGQNPIEPAKLGAAIVHGPHVGNFTDIYAALDEAHGAERIEDESGLAAALGRLLSQPATHQQVTAAARTTVENLSGALERTLQSLEPYLLQVRLGGRGANA
jgi:3-deoxy-D-manno-octulosonic-acid transferase